MAISVTQFKADCLELIRTVEKTGRAIVITRRGHVVARLLPGSDDRAARGKPWENLANSATCNFSADESVLSNDEFEASR
jgi:prevent-host-death family protein